jgi:hypothetical protein
MKPCIILSLIFPFMYRPLGNSVLPDWLSPSDPVESNHALHLVSSVDNLLSSLEV